MLVCFCVALVIYLRGVLVVCLYCGPCCCTAAAVSTKVSDRKLGQGPSERLREGPGAGERLREWWGCKFRTLGDRVDFL